jgi:PAS domain S-box-containing protein
VTDGKRVELGFGDSEQRFQTVFEGASVGMIEIDSDWRILSSNPAYREITGYSAEDLSGMDCLAFTHPEDVERSRTQLDALGDSCSRVSFEKRYVRKDGSVVWIRSNIARIGDGSRLLKIVEDIGERRRAEEALEAERSYLETLNRVGSALAGELDLERVVQMVTDAGVDLTGAQFGAFFYNVANAAGEGYMLYTLSGAERSQFERFGMPRNTQVFGPTFAGEDTVRSDDITADPRYGHNAPHRGMPDGHLPVVSYLAVPVMGSTGEVIGGLFFGHPAAARFNDRHERLIEGLAAQASTAIDKARLFREAQGEIDQRVKAEQALTVLNETLETRVEQEIERRSSAEEALRQAQKMETIGQLSGGIAHDFNNLLQIIQGNLTMLRHSLPPEQQKWHRSVSNALTGTERAAALTQRLLAFSRRQPLRAKAVNLNVMIKEMGELLHRTIGEMIEIETGLEDGLRAAQVDENQLENAILNLAINARDAMPDGGRLRIETSSAEIDEDYAAAHPDAAPGSYVRVAVIDSGTGMSPEVLARAVEPFFTTKEVGRGTGLGLSMVYGFASQSGGHLNVRSVEGEGTSIELFLPFARQSAELANADSAISELRRGRGETILVCEDDEDVREFSTTTLRDLGYEVREASDAAEALVVLRQAGDLDLLFTDVVLPGATNGAELAREARKLRPRMKVLLTTGYARSALDDADVQPPLELISKPFSVERLAIRLRQLLD